MQGEFPISIILQELEADDLLPAILFRTARRLCDMDVEKIAKNPRSYLPRSKQEYIKDLIDKVIEKYNMDKDVVYNHPQYTAVIRTGIGAHHAGQLLVWRLVLEEIMSLGALRILVATGTVAAGVDFPARTVIVTAHSRRGNEGFQVIASSEFQQMSGRAGRRGKDSVGICLIAPSPFSDARVLAQVAKRPPEPLVSSYFASPSTVLNLLKHRSPEELAYTVSKSLAAFLDRKAANVMREQSKKIANIEQKIELVPEDDQEETSNKLSEKDKKTIKRAKRMLREADELEARQSNVLNISLKGLQALGHLVDGKLSAKGAWAAELRTSLVLELSEAISSELLFGLENLELISLVASISGDAYRHYFTLRKNPIKAEYYQKMAEAIGKVKESYEGSQFASEVQVQPDAALTVLTWCEAQDWKEYAGLLRLSGVTEGDAARLISQTADHLSQISRLTESHTELARQAEECRFLLMRPPVTDTYNLVVAS